MASQALPVSLRGLLVLLIVLGVVLGYAVWYDRPSKDPQDQQAERKPLLQVEAATIRAVELDHGPVAVRLERASTDTWKMTRPEIAEADPRTVLSLIRAVADTRIEQVVATAGDPSAYGLDTPHYTLRLFGEDATKPVTTVRVGRASPIGVERYGSVGDGGRVLLVDGTVVNALDRDAPHFRERRLVPLDPERVRRLVVRRAGDTLVLERSGESWSLLEPVRDRADDLAADGLLRQVTEASVSRFAEAGESGQARKALTRAAVRLEVSAQGAPESPAVTIASSGEGEERWASRGTSLAGGPPLLGPVPRDLLDVLHRPADEFRDRGVTSFSDSDVRELRFIQAGNPRSGGSVRLARGDAGRAWRVQVGSGPERDAQQDPAAEVLDRVRMLRASSFLDPGAAIPPADLEIVVVGRAGELGRVQIGAATGQAGEALAPARSTWRPGIGFTLVDESLGLLRRDLAQLTGDR